MNTKDQAQEITAYMRRVSQFFNVDFTEISADHDGARFLFADLDIRVRPPTVEDRMWWRGQWQVEELMGDIVQHLGEFSRMYPARLPALLLQWTLIYNGKALSDGLFK